MTDDRAPIEPRRVTNQKKNTKEANEHTQTYPGAEPSRYFGRALPGIQTSPAAARVVVVTDDLGAAVMLTARVNVRAEANIFSSGAVDDRVKDQRAIE
jgi:hypothetical protein